MQKGTQYITVEEVAERLGISRNAAYLAVKSGDIPSVKIGRTIRVPRDVKFPRTGEGR